MVEDGWKLLKPEEVVINLEYESDFKPYLYKLPLELGTFHQLFKHLGTEDVISTKQYVEVLSRIFKNSEGKQLDPSEMRTVKGGFWPIQESARSDFLSKCGATWRTSGTSASTCQVRAADWSGRASWCSARPALQEPDPGQHRGADAGGPQPVLLGKDHGFHTKLIMLFPQKLRPAC